MNLLVKLRVGKCFDNDPEKQTGELPPRADLVLTRKPGMPTPFKGLWSYLTEWNVFELKGPTDNPEQEDLDRLLGVSYLTRVHLNGRRCEAKLPTLHRSALSMWYFSPTIGKTLLWNALEISPNLRELEQGVWCGKTSLHPLFLVSYCDLKLDPDTVFFHLLNRTPGPLTRAAVEMIVRDPQLFELYGYWLHLLQPSIWKEVQHMGLNTGFHVDWEQALEVIDRAPLLKAIPADEVLGEIGIPRAVEIFGLKQVIESVGAERIITEMNEADLLNALRSKLSPEQRRKLVE